MKTTLNIRISEYLKKKLKKIASDNKRSMTGQIEYWIKEYGNKYERK